MPLSCLHLIQSEKYRTFTTVFQQTGLCFCIRPCGMFIWKTYHTLNFPKLITPLTQPLIKSHILFGMSVPPSFISLVKKKTTTTITATLKKTTKLSSFVSQLHTWVGKDEARAELKHYYILEVSNAMRSVWVFKWFACNLEILTVWDKLTRSQPMRLG